MRPSTRPANYCATHPPWTAPFYPKIALRSRRDRLTTDQRTRGSGRKQQVAKLDLTTSEILIFYRET
ncbi:hypothetical protein ALC60_04150 [Trachymyrmex zeteki]|uniref:Uncharacterized protein n=1 Tax=Mycetomoellerius zeteki TaxID=64791 RepID=A0A151X983_9HYME|nr:hypothetical protein ALC60_04150 [Trachymyrmex zeteki]